MDIRVSGHQIDTGAALQDYVSDKLQAMVEKYFSRALSSHVTFGKAGSGAYSSDIVTHVNKGLILKSHGEAHDVHQSFDQALSKIEKPSPKRSTRDSTRSPRRPRRSPRENHLRNSTVKN